MTFWFCHSCKRTWHSFVPTPDDVKKIRCFHCLAESSFRIKDDSLPENVTYEDYDKNLRKFKMIKRNELESKLQKKRNSKKNNGGNIVENNKGKVL